MENELIGVSENIRRIREIIRIQIPKIQTGWDIIFLARQPMKDASFAELQAAVDQLIERAGISLNNDVI